MEAHFAKKDKFLHFSLITTWTCLIGSFPAQSKSFYTFHIEKKLLFDRIRVRTRDAIQTFWLELDFIELGDHVSIFSPHSFRDRKCCIVLVHARYFMQKYFQCELNHTVQLVLVDLCDRNFIYWLCFDLLCWVLLDKAKNGVQRTIRHIAKKNHF